MLKVDFVTISTNSEIIKRANEVASFFNYSHELFDSVDTLAGKYDDCEVRFVMLSTEGLASKEAAAGMVQVARQIINNAFILAVVSQKLDPQSASFIKKSGANAVLLENEITESSKLEYLTSQKIKAPYIPIKSSEIKLNTTLDFQVFHLLPRNQKFLPAIQKGVPVSENKMQKLNEVGEVYVARDDIEKFKNYLVAHPDLTAAGLASRCRAQFLLLQENYVDLVLLLSDQSSLSSFDLGKQLMEKCETLADELMNSLGAVGDAWEVIDNAAVGSFSVVERSPAVASYAGLFSLMADIGKQNEIMIAALISDVGLLELDPKISKKLHNGQLDQLKEDERSQYEKHPIISLNLALSRKINISPHMKNIILCTHEYHDQKGFPNRPQAGRIPEEAFLIQFSEIVDQASLIKMGQARPPIRELRMKILEREYQGGRFPITFLNKLKPLLI